MKTRIAILTSSLFFLAAASAPAPCVAQSVAEFSVPFAFTANHNVIPAGDYNVQFVTDQLSANRSVTLVDTATGKKTILMVRPEAGPAIESHGYLVFQVAGSNHTLQEVRLPGTNMRAELTVPRPPKTEVATSQAPAVPTITIAAR